MKDSIAKYRLAYQQVFGNQQTKNISINEFNSAIKNIICINQNKEPNIIKQGSINYQNFNKLIEYIQNCKNGKQLSYNLIFSLLPNTFEYYKEFKQTSNKYPFYVYKSDLKNKKEIQQIFKWFIDDQQTIKENAEIVYSQLSDNKGLIIPFPNNLYMFILNRIIYTKMTICHELTHYFQFILNLQVIDNAEFTDEDLLKISFLNVDIQNLKYLFLKNQFIPNINDCCEVFSIIYIKYFKNISIQQFKNKVLNFCYKIDNKFNINQLFYLFNIENNNDIRPLYAFIISLFLDKNKDITLKIFNKTFNELNTNV